MDKNCFEEIKNHLLQDNKPSNYLQLIKKSLKGTPLEVLGQLQWVEQAKQYHPEGSVWNHTILVVDYAAKFKELAHNKEEFMISALLHDIGKKATTKKNKEGRWISYNHDKVGAKIALGILNYYNFPEEESINISNLVLYHMHHLYILKKLPFANIKNMIKYTDVNDIILLFLCDKLGRGNVVGNEESIFFDLKKVLETLNIEYNVKIDEINNNLIKAKSIIF